MRKFLKFLIRFHYVSTNLILYDRFFEKSYGFVSQLVRIKIKKKTIDASLNAFSKNYYFNKIPFIRITFFFRN